MSPSVNALEQDTSFLQMPQGLYFEMTKYFLQITDKPHDIGQAVRQTEQLGARVGVLAL